MPPAAGASLDGLDAGGGGGRGGAAAARARARAAFRYFSLPRAPAFMENAGGSQVPEYVADAVRDHLLYDCAQLGAGHEVSNRSTAKVEAAHATIEAFMGCVPPGAAPPAAAGAAAPSGTSGGGGHVALGPSTSQLLASLAACYARLLGPGDEIVVQEACHEANIGPWVRCAAASGATLRWWMVDATPAFVPPPQPPAAAAPAEAAADGGGNGDAALRVSFPCACPLSKLRALLSPATRLVAATHVSNLLGGVTDLPRLVALVREAAPRARLVVDGVAYAPHRAMDVEAWGVDWYAFSIYKTFGPHAAALYGRAAAFAELYAGADPALAGPNHFFVPASDPVYKFELGGISHEAAAGIVAVSDYLRTLAAAPEPPAASPTKAAAAGRAGRPLARAEAVAALATAAALEAPLAPPIVGLLQAHPRAILIGPGMLDAAGGGDGGNGGDSGGGPDHGWQERVPTVSFVHVSKTSQEVAAAVQARGFAIRHGHAYAARLMAALAPALMPYLRRGAPAPSGAGAPNGADASDGAGGHAGSGHGGNGGAGGGAFEDAAAALVADGVVRISLLHYNTEEEVAGLVAALGEVL